MKKDLGQKHTGIFETNTAEHKGTYTKRPGRIETASRPVYSTAHMVSVTDFQELKKKLRDLRHLGNEQRQSDANAADRGRAVLLNDKH